MAEGLELFENVLDMNEASKLAILISDLPGFGRRGKYEHVATSFLADPVSNAWTLASNTIYMMSRCKVFPYI